MKLRFSRHIFLSRGVDIFINFNKFDAADPDAPVGTQIRYLALNVNSGSIAPVHSKDLVISLTCEKHYFILSNKLRVK